MALLARTRPGCCPVNAPSETTRRPPTSTWSTPSGGSRGSEKLARSATLSAEKTTTSAALPTRQNAAICETEALSGQRGHLAHRLGQGQQLLLAGIATEHAAERSGHAGMRLARQREPVGPDHGPVEGEDAAHVVLGHEVEHGDYLPVRLLQELRGVVERGQAGIFGEIGDRVPLALGSGRRARDHDAGPARGARDVLPAGQAFVDLRREALEHLALSEPLEQRVTSALLDPRGEE